MSIIRVQSHKSSDNRDNIYLNFNKQLFHRNFTDRVIGQQSLKAQFIRKLYRNIQKMKSNINIFKRFFFDFTFCLLANSIKNKKFLFFIDFLEIFPLAALYLNPFFSYLSHHSIFAFYFEQIYPYLYFFHQNSEKQAFPTSLFVFTLLFIIVAILRKQKPNIIITILQIGISLLPLLIFRIISQIINIAISQNLSQLIIGIRVCGIIMAIVVLLAGAVFIYWLKAYGKCCDFIVALLLILGVNQYVVFGALFLKNILNFFVYGSNPAKQVKIATQFSLFISILLLKVIRPLPSNYIMIASIVGLSIIFAFFRLFSRINRNDFFDISDFDEKNYTVSELELLKSMETHIKNCAQIHCICREVFSIKNKKELITWVPQYEKIKAKVDCAKIQRSSNLSDNFSVFWRYVKFCSDSENLDFDGYLLLHQFRAKNIFQQYIQYHYIKIYKLFLQKQPPNGLKMNIVNWDEDTNPYNDFFQLQNRVCGTIDKIKVFWRTLLDYNGENYFISLIEEISNELIKIKQLYSKIDESYDQKDQVDHYYNVFKILSLHQTSSDFHIDIQKVNYFLVTRGQNIINMTTNFTNLVERSRQELIGHSYTKIMHDSYLYNHGQWAKSYLQSYRIGQNQRLAKIISTGENRIKVVNMSHTIIPYFSLDEIQNQRQYNLDDGIYVVSVINHEVKYHSDDTIKQETAFHLLLNRDSLDILSYEYSIFQYFGIEPSVDMSNRLLRSNLKQIFPNISKQSLQKNQDRILLAKQNQKFFSDEDNNLKISKLCELNAAQAELNINKVNNQHLEVRQVLSKHNKELNLLLLKFINSKQKKAVERPKTGFNQIEVLKQQSQKQISSCQKQKQIQVKVKEKKRKNLEQRLKMVVLLISLLVLVGLITLHIFTNTQFSQLQNISNRYFQKSKFYTDFQYTKAFFLNLYVGENKLDQLERNWKYNQQYSSILTTFKVPSQENFILKFSQFIRNSFQKPVFSEVQNEEAKITELTQKLGNKLLIFSYSLLLIVCIQQILILIAFLRNEVKLEEGLQNFLLIPTKQISKNLQRIQHLEKILEVIEYNDFTHIITQVDLLKIENSEKLPSQSPSYSKIDYILEKRKRNQSNLSVNITKRNSSIQQILNSYIADSTIRGCENFESSISMLNRKQVVDGKRKYFQASSPLQVNNDLSQERKSLTISFSERFQRNIIFILLKIFNLSMKVGCFLFLLLYLQGNYGYMEICLELQQKLLREPAYTLRYIESFYLDKGKNENFLSKHQYEIKDILSASLPQQFDDFINYSNGLDSTQQSLCFFLEQEEEIKQCTEKLKLLTFGKNSLLQYIQERLRQGNKKALSVLSDVAQRSQVNLALKILLNIQKERSDKFERTSTKYYRRLGWIIEFSSYVTIILFFVSFLLQMGQIHYLNERKEKIENLFKIVPQYIKQSIQSIQLN